MSFADEGGELTAQLEAASNVLVLSPSMSQERKDACQQLLTGVESDGLNLLAVTYERSAEEWIESYLDYPDTSTSRLATVDVGGTTRSMSRTDPEQFVPGEAQVDVVESPGDLTGLGIKINEYLDTLDAARWGEGANQTAVCFDSLTAMLQYVSLERAFRFVHVFTARVSKTSATAHYHLDPAAHDDQTVATLRSLFDGVVKPGDEGWTVQTR